MPNELATQHLALLFLCCLVFNSEAFWFIGTARSAALALPHVLDTSNTTGVPKESTPAITDFQKVRVAWKS